MLIFTHLIGVFNFVWRLSQKDEYFIKFRLTGIWNAVWNIDMYSGNICAGMHGRESNGRFNCSNRLQFVSEGSFAFFELLNSWPLHLGSKFHADWCLQLIWFKVSILLQNPRQISVGDENDWLRASASDLELFGGEVRIDLQKASPGAHPAQIRLGAFSQNKAAFSFADFMYLVCGFYAYWVKKTVTRWPGALS